MTERSDHEATLAAAGRAADAAIDVAEAALALALGSAMVAAGVTAALEREATAVDTMSGAPAATPPARRTPRRGAAWVARVPR